MNTQRYASPEDIVTAVHRLDVFLSAPPLKWTSSQKWGAGLIKDWLENKITNQVEEPHLHMLLSRLLDLPRQKVEDHFGAFVGPMLKWAFAQPWSERIELTRPFSALCHQHFASRARTQRHYSCAAALNHILQWLPHFPNSCQDNLVKTTLNTIDTQMDWEYYKGVPAPQTNDTWYIFLQMSKLPAGDLDPTALSTNIQRSMRHAMINMNPPAQAEWLIGLLHSDMANNYKSRALSVAWPQAWLNPFVQEQALGLLPTDECERFAALPWEVDHRWKNLVDPPCLPPVELNQELLKQYCPNSQELVHGLASLDDWLNKSRIAGLIQAINAPQTRTQYALPDMDNECP